MINIKRGWQPTHCPAMLKGLEARLLEIGDILKKRIFPSLVELSDRWSLYYRGEIVTRAQEANLKHELKYAFR